MTSSSIKGRRGPPIQYLAQSAVLLAVLFAGTPPARGADVAGGKVLYDNCVSCHGSRGEGNAKLGAPNLTGQRAAYLSRQISAFVQGTRGADRADTFGAQMRSVVQVFQSDDDIDNVAAYLESLPLQRSAGASGAAATDVAKGRSYYNGICSACHGSDGTGNAPLNTPRLAGQDEAYLARQYAHFKSGVRGADRADTFGAQMRSMVKALPDEATEAAVLTYAAGLGAAH